MEHTSQMLGMRGLGPHLSATYALWSSPKALVESSFRSRGQRPGGRAGALTGPATPGFWPDNWANGHAISQDTEAVL